VSLMKIDFTRMAKYFRQVDTTMPKLPYLSPIKNWHSWHTYLKIHPSLNELVTHLGGEAKVYLADRQIYDYHLCGPEPRSAGDTHGAIETDGKVVYFGGWAEAPAMRDPITQTHDRSGKISHLHMIDENGDVKLLWMKKWDENIDRYTEWYAEVTDLLWDPYRKVLWVARGDIVMDTHPGLRDDGLYYWDPSTQELKPFRVNPGTGVYLRMYKMDTVHNFLVLNSELGNTIYMYDFRNDTWTDITSAVDFFDTTVSIPRGHGGFVARLQTGHIYVWQSGMLLAFRGRGVTPPFRAIPFFTCYFEHEGATRLAFRVGGRAQKLRVGKGIIVPATQPQNLPGDEFRETLLIYMDGVSPKIIMSAGYTSGLESDGKYVYIASGHWNSEQEIVFNTQSGSIYAIPVWELLKAPLESVRVQIMIGTYTPTIGVNGYIGGIPTRGFRKKKLKIYVDRTAVLTVMHYTIGLAYIETEDISLSTGWNTIDLSQYDNILAFKLDVSAFVKAYMALDL
jgi:Uncharacterized protein conserved in archaea